MKKSDADFIVLGGDFNSDPVVNSHETTLTDIKQVMVQKQPLKSTWETGQNGDKSYIRSIHISRRERFHHYHHDYQEMVSAIEEFFKTLQRWLVATEATYGNPQNSYSANYAPVHYDYIFHRANNNNTMWTDWFNVSC